MRNVDQTYNLLSDIQKKLFKDYGLRQVKYMFEKDTVFQNPPPDGSVLVGLSNFGKWCAIDYDKEIRYGYFAFENPKWSAATTYGTVTEFDKVEDFRKIYDLFELKNYALDELTRVHLDFLQT